MNTCATCRWFRAMLNTSAGGICLRYPPTMHVSAGRMFAQHPSVSEKECCGEHAPLESLGYAQAVQGKPAASEPTTFECAACNRQVNLAELRPQKFMSWSVAGFNVPLCGRCVRDFMSVERRVESILRYITSGARAKAT